MWQTIVPYLLGGGVVLGLIRAGYKMHLDALNSAWRAADVYKDLAAERKAELDVRREQHSHLLANASAVAGERST